MKARKLKCWFGNYDGIREGLIVSTSKKKAAWIAGCSVKTFDDYWHEQTVPINVKPNVLYTRPFDGKLWTEGRVEIKRNSP